MVDQQCLAGFLTRFGEFGLAREFVDQTRFAYVAPAYEGVLGHSGLRRAKHVGGRDGELCSTDHSKKGESDLV